MTDQFSLPITLDMPIKSWTTDTNEYGELTEVEETKTLGLIVAEKTAERVTRTISLLGGFGTYSGVNLDQLVNDRIEAAVTARVDKLLETHVNTAIIQKAQDLIDKDYRNESRYDETATAPEKVETLGKAVEILAEKWINTFVEDKEAPRNYGGYGSGHPRRTRLEIMVNKVLAPYANDAAEELLKDLRGEIEKINTATFEAKLKETREAAIEAVKQATSYARGHYIEN